MKRNISFSILIIAFLVQIAFAINRDESIFSERSLFRPEKIQDPFDGKEVVVRVYNDWKNDPNAYKKTKILYENFSKLPAILNANFNNLQSFSVVVIVEEDQANEQVKAAIAGSALAERLDKLKEGFYSIPELMRNKNAKEVLFIEDALGDTIPGAIVDVYIRDFITGEPEILLTSIKAKDGLLEIPRITGSIKSYSFRISSPGYGTTLVKRPYLGNHIKTPFVNKESMAYERSIRGRIVDPDGKPLKDVVVQCSNIRTLGEGLIDAIYDDGANSITDKNGEFCLYLPNEQNDERGYMIPPGSTYNVRIKAPKELGLLPIDGPVVNDSEKLIVMEKADHFRTFIFEDEKGVIADSERLKFININISRPDKRSFRINYKDFKDGGYYPLGEYKANMYIPGEEFEFDPVIVDENSPEVIVMKLPEKVIYDGQVIHGMTGQPMSGAFVIAFNSSSRSNLSMITPEQWDALHKLPLEPELDNPAVKPVGDIYGIKKIVRTDGQGHFQMSFIPGEVYGFIAFEENFLGVMQRRFNLTIDENRISKIPAIKLYPAAKVVVNLKTEERISVNSNWIINENNNPSWVKEFLTQKDKSEREYITVRRWLEQNNEQSFYIPANLNVQIKLETPYDEQWCPIDVPETFNLAQGQVIDLGDLTFKPAVEVFVQVVDSRGEPVEGIPVRSLMGKRIWSVAHNSDESGIASFYISPGPDIQFGVSYEDENGKYMTKTISCDVKGREDKGKLFTMQLSEEILERLFDTEKRI